MAAVQVSDAPLRHGADTSSASKKRYFFHISNGTSISPDQYGLVLPDLPAALGNATEALLALRTSGDHLQEDWSHWTMEVRDEHDTEVVRLPFSEVIEGALQCARPHLR